MTVLEMETYESSTRLGIADKDKSFGDIATEMTQSVSRREKAETRGLRNFKVWLGCLEDREESEELRKYNNG